MPSWTAEVLTTEAPHLIFRLSFFLVFGWKNFSNRPYIPPLLSFKKYNFDIFINYCSLFKIKEHWFSAKKPYDSNLTTQSNHEDFHINLYFSLYIFHQIYIRYILNQKSDHALHTVL